MSPIVLARLFAALEQDGRAGNAAKGTAEDIIEERSADRLGGDEDRLAADEIEAGTGSRQSTM